MNTLLATAVLRAVNQLSLASLQLRTELRKQHCGRESRELYAPDGLCNIVPVKPAKHPHHPLLIVVTTLALALALGACIGAEDAQPVEVSASVNASQRADAPLRASFDACGLSADTLYTLTYDATRADCPARAPRIAPLWAAACKPELIECSHGSVNFHCGEGVDSLTLSQQSARGFVGSLWVDGGCGYRVTGLL